MRLEKIKNNFHSVENGSKESIVYFSYETPIAFAIGSKMVIRVNDWKQTTGKHLNWINDDKSLRISGEEFEKQLLEANL